MVAVAFRADEQRKQAYTLEEGIREILDDAMPKVTSSLLQEVAVRADPLRGGDRSYLFALHDDFRILDYC